MTALWRPPVLPTQAVLGRLKILKSSLVAPSRLRSTTVERNSSSEQDARSKSQHGTSHLSTEHIEQSDQFSENQPWEPMNPEAEEREIGSHDLSVAEASPQIKKRNHLVLPIHEALKAASRDRKDYQRALALQQRITKFMVDEMDRTRQKKGRTPLSGRLKNEKREQLLRAIGRKREWREPRGQSPRSGKS